MDRKISAAIFSGESNGRGRYSTYLSLCPPLAKFRTTSAPRPGRMIC